MLVALGCSKGLVRVSGKVTLDDKPLEGAEVSFVPDGGGHAASGFTGSDGTFRLTTYTTGDGVEPGDYKVTVIKKEESSLPTGPSGQDPEVAKEMMKKFQQGQGNKGPKKTTTLPAEYSDPAKTKLRCKVPPDGSVEFNLRSSGGV
jgi:hypothetical protein